MSFLMKHRSHYCSQEKKNHFGVMHQKNLVSLFDHVKESDESLVMTGSDKMIKLIMSGQ